MALTTRLNPARPRYDRGCVRGAFENGAPPSLVTPMPRPLLVLLVAALGASFADAQDQSLTGVESVSVLVDDLDPDNVGCGLSEDAIRLAVTNAFQAGNITVSSATESVIAYVRIATTTPENSDRCTSDYEISLMARVEVAPPLVAESVSGLLALRREAGTESSAHGDHAARVTAGLSGLARNLALQMHRANEPTASTVVEPVATTPAEENAYRVARCQELLSSPRLVPVETRVRDLEELKCQELVVAP